VPVPDHIHRYWCALDDLFSHVTPTWWGAVITDGRFPRIWDANYARVDVAQDLPAAEIELALLPALHDAGANLLHVVSFHPEATTGLLAELSGRGHRLGWDLVMEHVGDPLVLPPDLPVDELASSPELWSRVGDSLALFGVEPGEAVDQLRRIEEDVLSEGGKRWFGVRDAEGTLVSLAALLLLEDVGYIDNVVTFPDARGRGYASGITARLVSETRASGARGPFLLADPDEEAVVGMYRRLGFRDAGMLASTRGPLPEVTRA
jgi:ribosomal protein S18 acetylase RimI-like enzyme